MPRKLGQTALTIPMSKAELDLVHRIARKRKVKITSDYVRQLIEADAKKVGVDLTFEVDRGGYRERSTDNDADTESSLQIAA